MRECDPAGSERDLMIERSLAKRMNSKNVPRPAKRIGFESDSTIALQNQVFPNRDGREPELTVGSLQQAFRLPSCGSPKRTRGTRSCREVPSPLPHLPFLSRNRRRDDVTTINFSLRPDGSDLCAHVCADLK